MRMSGIGQPVATALDFEPDADHPAPRMRRASGVGCVASVAGPTANRALRAKTPLQVERGTVRVTASEVIGGEVLPPFLADLNSRNPRISVELALSNRNEDLLRGDADIAVRMVRRTQGALIAKRIGRIDIGLYAHRHFLKGRAMPQRLEDLREHALIGYDRDRAYSRLLERMGVPFTGDMFAFRSDSDLAQLAALRAGFGIGACQLGIGRRLKNLVPLLHSEFIIPMEAWLARSIDCRDPQADILAGVFDGKFGYLEYKGMGACPACHSRPR